MTHEIIFLKKRQREMPWRITKIDASNHVQNMVHAIMTYNDSKSLWLTINDIKKSHKMTHKIMYRTWYTQWHKMTKKDSKVGFWVSAPACTTDARVTGWRWLTGSLIFIGHFPQKWPIFSGSFVENNLQLRGCYESSPHCTQELELQKN